MSAYLDDAALFLREGSLKISADMDKLMCIQSVLNVALGIERILKEILYRVNPLYVLINPEFKNSAPVFYKEQILDSERTNKDLNKTPDPDVLTFSNSLLRACYFSKTTLENKSLLFKICNYRDIIAHNELRHISIPELKLLLQRDIYRLVKSYADEVGCTPGKLFGGASIKLADLSASLQQDVAIPLEALFQSHKARWDSLKGRLGFIEDKDKVTQQILATKNKISCICPACKNSAIIYGRDVFEYNINTHQEDHIGTKVSKLKCHYCKLELLDYKYIDHLGLSKTFDKAGDPDSIEDDVPDELLHLGLASVPS